jgi:hypothetical protein
MTDNLVPNIKGLICEAKPFPASWAAYGFAPVKEGGQSNDEQNRYAAEDEDADICGEGDNFREGQGAPRL